MLPNPMKPTLSLTMRGPLSAFLERELAVGKRGEVRRDVVWRDLGQPPGPPAGAVVLVDDQRAHALGEIMPGHEAMDKPVFQAHGRIEVEGVAGLQLPEGHREAGRRL